MSDDDDTLPLSENAFRVSRAQVVVVDRRNVSRQSPEPRFVVQIETEEHPDASPFHFWMDEDQLRQLVDAVSPHLPVSGREARQILAALDRIEERLR